MSIGAGLSPNRPRAFAENLVWDTNTLEWVAMVQAGAGGGLTDAELRASPVLVDATIDTTGLATSAGQAAENASLDAMEAVLVGAYDSGIGMLKVVDSNGSTLSDIAVNTSSLDAELGAIYTRQADGTQVTKQVTGQGRTLLFAAIAQGAAGTTTLVAADGTKKIKVVSYVFTLSLAGTVKFIDNTPTDLTGAMTLSATGGAGTVGQSSSHLFETAVNKALQIVSTVGAANGHISYFLEA